MLRWPIEPMRAAGAARLPEAVRASASVYEPKWDGFRALAWVGQDGAQLQSRHGKPLTRYFPDVCRALAEHLPPGVILDGELVSWDVRRGRTSFVNLQRRITAGRSLAREAAEHPAHLVSFDVLQADGKPLLNQSLGERRTRLEQLLADAPPQLPICPQTTDAHLARSWFAEWSTTGVEGLILKSPTGRYRPGKIGWIKVKMS